MQVDEQGLCDNDYLLLKNTTSEMKVALVRCGDDHGIVLKTNYRIENTFLWCETQLEVVRTTIFSVTDDG